MVNVIKIKYFKSFKNEALTANGTNELPIPQDKIDTHKFFNELVVVNTSSSDLIITPDHNSDREFPVPAKGNITWSFKDDNFKFSRIKYTEVNGSAVAANAVYFIVAKKRFEQGVE